MNNNPWSQTIEAQQPSAKPEWLTEEIEGRLNAFSFPLNRDGLLMLHKHAKEKLDFWKEEEMMLRKIAVVELVPARTEGTTNVELGNGFKAKVNHKYNYSIKDNDNKVIWNILDKIKNIGNQGAFIAERLISWSPSFLKTEYNMLIEEADGGSDDAKAILKIVNEELLTIEPAAPELKIVEPKKKSK